MLCFKLNKHERRAVIIGFVTVLSPFGQTRYCTLSHVAKFFLIIVMRYDLLSYPPAMADLTTVLKETVDLKVQLVSAVSTFCRQRGARKMQRLTHPVREECSQLRQVALMNSLSSSNLLSDWPWQEGRGQVRPNNYG